MVLALDARNGEQDRATGQAFSAQTLPIRVSGEQNMRTFTCPGDGLAGGPRRPFSALFSHAVRLAIRLDYQTKSCHSQMSRRNVITPRQVTRQTNVALL